VQQREHYWIEGDEASRMENGRGRREREREADRNSSCVEGLAFVRWAAFNPVADSGLGIWTLGCIRKREREDENQRERERERVSARGEESRKRE